MNEERKYVDMAFSYWFEFGIKAHVTTRPRRIATDYDSNFILRAISATIYPPRDGHIEIQSSSQATPLKFPLSILTNTIPFVIIPETCIEGGEVITTQLRLMHDRKKKKKGGKRLTKHSGTLVLFGVKRYYL